MMVIIITNLQKKSENNAQQSYNHHNIIFMIGGELFCMLHQNGIVSVLFWETSSSETMA